MDESRKLRLGLKVPVYGTIRESFGKNMIISCKWVLQKYAEMLTHA